MNICSVSSTEQIFIHFNDALPILTSQETKILKADSSRQGESAGETFLPHLDPMYANRELTLEVNYQNAELIRYCSKEIISPHKRQIIEFNIKKT